MCDGFGAVAGVQGQQHVGGAAVVFVGDADAHAQRAQHLGPALCRDAVASVGAAWRWGDQEVDRLALRAFLGACARRGLAKRSIARKLASTRGFFAFLQLEERIPSNPGRTVRAPKLERRLPGHLTGGDVEAVFAFAESQAAENTLAGTRTLLILELLYGSGLRLSEVHGIDLAAIDRRTGQVRVLGKGSKERIVPVTESALRALGRYEPRRAEVAAADESALLVNASGGRLSRRSIQGSVRGCLEHAAGARGPHPDRGPG